jgi:F420-dependent oxidoreductase-like protein
MTNIEFGLQIEPQYGFSYNGIKEIAMLSEALGFESLWVSDHFFMTEDSVDINCLECWTTLTALARDTRYLKIGAMVSAQSYRNPALLAKIAASLDCISNGRLYFGVGAGWKRVEYQAYGYPFPKFVIRNRQLEECIQIVKEMWTKEKATFQGQYYTINNALCYPKPVQKPHIPIWIGGYGERTLKSIAKYADACNFAWTLPVELVKERLKILRRYCQEIGRNYDLIRKSCGLMVTLAATEKGVRKKLDFQAMRKDTPYMRYLGKQLPNLIGTPHTIAERIREYSKLDVNHIILRFHYGDEMECLNLFKDEVKNLL